MNLPNAMFMKKTAVNTSWYAILLVAFLTCCTSCSDEVLQEWTEVETNSSSYLPSTLSVSLGDADTRLIFDEVPYGEKTALMSSWSEEDAFRIVGSQPASTPGYVAEDDSKSMVYWLTEGAGTTQGVFESGDPAFSEDELYYIYYPASLTNWADFALFNYDGQVQNGNSSIAHLGAYHTMRKSIWRSEFDGNISFSGNNLYQSSCMKFNLSGLPEALVPASIQLSAVDAEGETINDLFPTRNFSTGVTSTLQLQLEGFTSTTSVTAYRMMSAEDVELPEGASLRVRVTGSNGEYYYADKPAGGKTIRGGCLNTLTVTEGWQTIYESNSYDKDQIVERVQTAIQGEGNGIDIVIMGDGFSDRLIADGTYDEVMEKAYEDFFSIEPHLSYKQNFNVYKVYAVSKHEDMEYENRETALGCQFGEGTHIEGNSTVIQNYAKLAIGNDDDRLNNMLIIVLINSSRYAGTCHYFAKWENDSDYGVGSAIAYVSMEETEAERKGTLLHECGHGFAKLSDEYDGNGTMPNDRKDTETWWRIHAGWNKNVDFTANPYEVCWSEFIGDSRYPEVGIYEGGCTYDYGVYRPTENSIMRHNEGEYNAPSRRAIYYRINKLLDPTFTDDYEQFVAWDQQRNRVQHVVSTTRSAIDWKDFVPLAPPVVKIGYWKDGIFMTE